MKSSKEVSMEWKKCSVCKTPINYSSRYYVCSVSSCNTKRTGLSFCSVSCFDQHIPGARHKSAGAVEEKAPSQAEASKITAAPAPVRRRIIPQQGKLSNPSNKQASKGGEVLVIASRFKAFINDQAEYNTSASVMDVISDHLRHVAMQAIDNARADGRKTVMEQDLKFLNKLNLNV
ncbi:MAG: hypothetical protein AAF203_05240 [Pseudomonadota bacterium]